MFATHDINSFDSFKTPVNQKKITKCILLVGPRIGNLEIQQLKKGLENQRLEIKQIGDGEKLETHDPLYFHLINSKRNKERYLLVILAHGSKYNQYTLDTYIKKSALFQAMTAALKDQPIDILDTSCYSGSSCSLISSLPKNSNLMTMSSSTECTDYGHSSLFYKQLQSTVLPSMTAENLFILYLSINKSQDLQINGQPSKFGSPMFCNNDITVSSLDLLKKLIGKKFSFPEKQNILRRLKNIAPQKDTLTTIQQIEETAQASGIIVSHLPCLALAIAYVNSKPAPARDQTFYHQSTPEFKRFLRERLKNNPIPINVDAKKELEIKYDLKEIRKNNATIKQRIRNKKYFSPVLALFDTFVEQHPKLKEIYKLKQNAIDIYSAEGIKQLFELLEDKAHHHQKTGVIKFFTLSYNSIRQPKSFQKLQELRKTLKDQYGFDPASYEDSHIRLRS